jgi:pSer/pThr/pTyr-binding forkhead associated (FHA) protein
MGIGGYGGLTCAVVAAAALAIWALVYRRGTTSQSAMGILICLVCAALMIFPLWWEQARLQFLGSSLDDIEVAVVLTWIALFGWTLPLGMLVSFVLLAEPHTPGERPPPRRSPLLEATLRLSLADPARYLSVRDDDAPWAQLAMVGDEQQTSGARPLLLRGRLTLIGREVDNDIILNDERISRHHAEIRMDHSVAVLRDYGSMNGTRINKQPVIQPTPLKVGDILELGMRRYRFSLLDGAAAYEVETSKMPGASGVNRKQTLPPVGPPALVAVNGAAEGSRWDLLEPVNSIGRDPTCQIQLPDTTVSRRHAQVVRQTDGYYASDLESINGTKVNEDDLKAPRRLIHGDLLHLGTVALRFESTLPPQSDELLTGESDNQPPAGRVSSGQITIPFTRGAVLLPLDDDQPLQP